MCWCAVLSVVVPVFNEVGTLGRVLVALGGVLPGVGKEVIVVDDGSTDGTREWLKRNFPLGEHSGTALALDGEGELVSAGDGDAERSTVASPALVVKVIFHEANRGKGASLRTGFAAVTGDVVVIQDADLEYDPQDWVPMYDLVAVQRVADVVYGSRFHDDRPRTFYAHHYVANRLISRLFSAFHRRGFSDVETCYKMMTREVLGSLALTADGFGIEIEMSAQIARQRGLRIRELGIHYRGRAYREGKKIGWRDGVMALWYVFKYRFA